MDTNSLVNMMMSGSNKTPTVGMGATELMWTDRHAYTVVKVCTPRKVMVRRDTATRTDKNGWSEDQTYTFEPGKEGYDEAVTLRKDGKWRGSNGGSLFTLGRRDEYSDPNF